MRISSTATPLLRMISADVPISSEVWDAWPGPFSVQLKNTARRSEKLVLLSSHRAICLSLRSIGHLHVQSRDCSQFLSERLGHPSGDQDVAAKRIKSFPGLNDA